MTTDLDASRDGTGALRPLLKRIRACGEAVEWVADQSLTEAWATCERADWMLWLVGQMAGKDGWPTRQQVVLAACACAETALRFVPKGEDRPRRAIETARRWARGLATLTEVRDAAYDAADDAAAYAAAAYAAAASAYAADAAAAYAADAAAYAADAAAYAADAAARTKALRECADLVRKELGTDWTKTAPLAREARPEPEATHP